MRRRAALLVALASLATAACDRGYDAAAARQAPQVGEKAAAGPPPAVRPPAVASYAERQAAYEAEREGKGTAFTADERAIIERAKSELAAAMPNPGLNVGERAPDFTLPDPNGEMVSLAARLADGPVVVVFYRGAWCPFCNLYLRALKDSLPAFEHYGAALIAVTPQMPDKSAEQVREDGYPFDVLSDLDGSVMKSYRLHFDVDPKLEALYRDRGLVLADYNGEGRNILPAPGTFILDRDGIVRAASSHTDYKQRMEPAAIVAALAQLDGN